MPRFWLGVLDIDQKALAGVPPSQAEPIASARPKQLAIEVIEGDASEYAVLFSSWTGDPSDALLTCCIGFANGARSCTAWRDRGFPLVEAAIEYDPANKGLVVRSACFGAAESMDYDTQLVTLQGIDFGAPGGEGPGLHTVYAQAQLGPDDLWPASYVMRKAVQWEPVRSRVERADNAQVALTLDVTRCPGFAPLPPRGVKEWYTTWTGEVDLPAPPPRYLEGAPQRLPRADTFGIAAFRFENVDVLGFRVELDSRRPDLEPLLEALIEPLNFHLRPNAEGGSRLISPDFRYRVASPTLLIEILRYGKMKLKTPQAPLRVLDYQSQHELLVRVLVGRVDDDTAQAHSPAAYVPAILVDNPWSKALGRDVQGFDKRLADFCVLRRGKDAAGRSIVVKTALRPDGVVRSEVGGGPVPLTELRHVCPVTRAGAPPGNALLDIDCSGAVLPLDGEHERIDLDLALGSSNLSVSRWRQTDFDDPEYRRSFARSAAASTLHGFRSIQVSPVGNRPFDDTWITGTFNVDDDVRFGRPSGVATLTVHDDATAPRGWRQLCQLIGADDANPATLSFPTGSWYLMKCAMDLVIDNGLD